MLYQETVFGRVDKVQKAIDRLKSFEPPEGYYLAFSGGKDSQCVYHLAKMAGVKFDAHYSVTTVDPPELMRFIRDNYPDVEWERHYWPDGKQITMWNLIASHTIPPTRQNRYCCADLKETSGKGRIVVTGTRWAESVRRRDLHGVVNVRTKSKKFIQNAVNSNSAADVNNRGSLIFMDDNDETRQLVESCYIKKRTTVNPIIDWEDEDVWQFLNEVAIVPHCCLYDEGLTRLGCIGCPLAGREKMIADFERYPRYKQLYIRAFDLMIANHPGEIKVATGETAEPGGGGAHLRRMEPLARMNWAKEWMNWWLTDSEKQSNQPPQRERERERENGKLPVAQNARSMESRILDRQQLAGGGVCDWWMWIHREQQHRQEQNPTTRRG